jgi:hypothetical protein
MNWFRDAGGVADDEVSLVQERERIDKVVERSGKVDIGVGDDVAARSTEPRSQNRAVSQVCGVTDETYLGVFPAKALRDRSRTVGGTIVDEDDLEVSAERLKGLECLTHCDR